MEELKIGGAIAAKDQPREAVDRFNRRALPCADQLRQQQSSLLQLMPLECRLLKWECILQPSQTRIERWRLPNTWYFESANASDADCFPFRLTTGGAEKTEKLLSLLLCCRQLYLEGLSILYPTTFVFEMPLDLYAFLLCASLDGLSNVKGLIIPVGQFGWSGRDPLLPGDYPKQPYEVLAEWEKAIHGLERMGGLKELQIWLGNRYNRNLESERRPWKEDGVNEQREQRHCRLFDIFGTVNVPRFTIHLTWNPRDLLAQRQWPFKIELHTKDEMKHVIDDELLEKREPDLFDW